MTPQPPDEHLLDAASHPTDEAHLADALADPTADPESVRGLLGDAPADVAAAAIGQLRDESRARDVLLWLPPEQSASILAALDPARAASLAVGLPSDERADLLAEMPEEAQAAVRPHLPAETLRDADRLMAYPADTAGGLMETELLAYPAQATVRDAIRDLRANQPRYAAVGVQYIYLRDDAGRLVGVAPIRDLMLSPEDAPLLSLIKREPATLLDSAPLHEVAAAFEQHPFIALPVVNAQGVLLGVINRADATQREQEEAEDDYRVSQGIVGGEELRSMPVVARVRRRGAWLGVNLVLCLGGAGVIAAFQDTLAKAIVVAAVLPVISATCGNAAMQAAAVSIRELTLGVIEPRAWRRVMAHELTLAALLALPLGVAIAVLATAWGAPWTIGLAVGGAMALNAAIAVGLGGVCPLVLSRFRIDPALASGPISTTLADVTGFALTLTLVSLTA